MNKRLLTGVVICAWGLLLRAEPVRAAEWFISPGGNDANVGTSEATPFKSLQKADSMLAPGDTITALDGTYPAGAITKSGTPGAWITVRAKNRRAALFSLAESARENPGDAGLVERNGFWLANVSYIKLIGISVQGWNPNHVVVDSGHGICIQACHHILVQDCRVSDCSGGGIGGSPEYWIGSKKIKRYLDFITVEGNEVSGCAFWNRFDASGIGMWVATSCGMGADPSGYNIIIRRNVSYGNANKVGASGKDIQTASDGNGIIIDYFQSYPYATLVERNLVYDNGGRGVTSTHSSNLTYRYNTCWHNACNALGVGSGGPWATGELDSEAGDNVLIEGNIAVSNSFPWSRALVLSAKTAVLRNNLLAGPRKVDKSVHLTESGTIVADPKFNNPSADPKVADFRLQAGSPARSAANDLGAYQQPP